MDVVMAGFRKEAEQTRALQSRAGKHCCGTEGLCPPNPCMEMLISPVGWCQEGEQALG